VSGRRASDARRVVSLGSIAYLGSHGSEILHPGSIAPEMDRELQAWTRRVQNFARAAYSESLRKLRVRLEDKEAIAALHWRDVPDEEEAEAAIREVAEAAEKAGFNACGSTRAPGSCRSCATASSRRRCTWATTPRTSTRSAA
jgi:trehalose 6-phosphate phosphatase